MSTSTRRSALALLALVVGLQACTDEISTPTTAGAPVTARVGAEQDSAATRLARGLAGALADPALRQQVLEDLRDSPVPGHRLHLQSYLHGTRGRALVNAAAAALRVAPADLLAQANGLPPMEIMMPISLDRAFWTGSGDVAVAGTALTLGGFVQGGRPIPAYTTMGQAVPLHPLVQSERPIIALLASTHGFGPNPEAERARAPRKQRPTVSTRQAEFEDGVTIQDDVYHPCMVDSYAEGCEDYFCNHDPSMCPPPYDPTAPTEGIQLPSEISWTSCTTNQYPDTDRDAIRDDCEAKLAKAFEPVMRFSVNDGGVSREPYWSARRGADGEIQVFYMIAYHRDYGSYFGATGHYGDSEFVILRLVQLHRDGLWAVRTATLSAHWGTSGNSTETHPYSDLEYDTTPRSRPLVWVAENKHANYNNIYSCDAGSYWTDTCDNNYLSGFVPMGVIEDANVGNAEIDSYGWSTGRVQLRNCVSSRVYSNGFWECFWSHSTFAGWRVMNWEQDGLAGGYRKSLKAYGF